MGKRARKGGIANAALRAARSARRERDEEAHAIAQGVYNTAVELKRETTEDDRPLPLPALAPMLVACERVAPGAVALAGLDPRDRQLVEDTAAYLLHVFRDVVWRLDLEHFEQWRRDQGGVETDVENTASSG